MNGPWHELPPSFIFGVLDCPVAPNDDPFEKAVDEVVQALTPEEEFALADVISGMDWENIEWDEETGEPKLPEASSVQEEEES